MGIRYGCTQWKNDRVLHRYNKMSGDIGGFELPWILSGVRNKEGRQTLATDRRGCGKVLSERHKRPSGFWKVIYAWGKVSINLKRGW